MVKLLDRNRQIPNGLKFYLPATKWSPRPWASFNEISQTLLAHLRGNPTVAQTIGWPLEIGFIESKVDEYNALICQQQGWMDYITAADGGAASPLPFQQAPLTNQFAQLRNVAAASPNLIAWIANKEEAVPQHLADARGAVCVECPKNGKGDWTRFFTIPVSEAIRAAYRQRTEMQLSTPYDDRLQVCEVCLCPLKLKVHMPLPRVLKGLDDPTKAALPGNCWIKHEGQF